MFGCSDFPFFDIVIAEYFYSLILLFIISAPAFTCLRSALATVCICPSPGAADGDAGLVTPRRRLFLVSAVFFSFSFSFSFFFLSFYNMHSAFATHEPACVCVRTFVCIFADS